MPSKRSPTTATTRSTPEREPRAPYGYGDSVDYVAGLLRDAGYEVTLDPVEITFNFPAVLTSADARRGRV